MSAPDRAESSQLFREEALEAATQRLGRPLNPFGLPAWLLTGFFLLVLTVVAIFMATGSYARKETVSGRVTLQGGAPRVVSSRPGIIDRVHVAEGQRVSAGDVLFTVAAESLRPEGGALGETLETAIADQGEARLKELQAQSSRVDHQGEEIAVRRAGLVRRIEGLKREVQLQGERVALAGVTVRDLRPLFESQQLAAIQYRQYESALLDARQQLSALERELGTAEADLRQLVASESVLRDEHASLAARIQAEMAVLAERQANLDGDRRFALAAPVDGIVTAMAQQAGAPVQPNGTLAVIVPEGAVLQVELWVPSRAIGFVRVGQDVRLMYDAFPYQRFGFGKGRVISVSNAPIPPSDLLGVAETTEPMFRVLASVEDPEVKAYGERWTLGPGMRLAADLVLEKRSFLDWVLDPLRAASLRS